MPVSQMLVLNAVMAAQPAKAINARRTKISFSNRSLAGREIIAPATAPTPKAPSKTPKVWAPPWIKSLATRGNRARTTMAVRPKIKPRNITLAIFGDMAI